MALGKIVITSLVLLAFIMSSVTAFISPLSSMTGHRVATASSRTHTSEHGLLMACRPNAKKAKRQRNRDNMRKFMKRGTSRKRVMRVQRQERAAETESNFMAQVFHSGMDDWEDVDIFAED